MRFKNLNILAALDFSSDTHWTSTPALAESSLRACRAAAALVSGGNGQLSLMHTGAYPSGFVADASITDAQHSRLLDKLDKLGREHLVAASKELPGDGVITVLEGVHGPSAQILRQLERGKHDMVALGGSGLGSLGQLALSAVTERVLRATPVPALVAGTEPGKWGLNKHPDILAAVDFSPPSLRALQVAVNMALRFEGTLSVIAVNSLPVTVPAGLWDTPVLEQGLERLIGDRTRALRKKLKALLQQTMPERLRYEMAIPEGPPATTILDRVQTEDHHVVVMGLSGESEATLGSVTRRYLRVSPIPTLVVP